MSAGANLDKTIVYEAFIKTFPLIEDSELLTKESVLIEKALEQLDGLDIPRNLTLFCQSNETFIVNILMTAVLGNLVRENKAFTNDHGTQPFLSDPISGEIVYVENFMTNRIIVFQVLVFSLVLALGRSWTAAKTKQP